MLLCPTALRRPSQCSLEVTTANLPGLIAARGHLDYRSSDSCIGSCPRKARNWRIALIGRSRRNGPRGSSSGLLKLDAAAAGAGVGTQRGLQSSLVAHPLDKRVSKGTTALNDASAHPRWPTFRRTAKALGLEIPRTMLASSSSIGKPNSLILLFASSSVTTTLTRGLVSPACRAYTSGLLRRSSISSSRSLPPSVALLSASSSRRSMPSITASSQALVNSRSLLRASYSVERPMPACLAARVGELPLAKAARKRSR